MTAHDQRRRKLNKQRAQEAAARAILHPEKPELETGADSDGEEYEEDFYTDKLEDVEGFSSHALTLTLTLALIPTSSLAQTLCGFSSGHAALPPLNATWSSFSESSCRRFYTRTHARTLAHTHTQTDPNTYPCCSIDACILACWEVFCWGSWFIG